MILGNWAQVPTSNACRTNLKLAWTHASEVPAFVHRQTQRLARHVGWTDRGVVAPGYLADLNVIDTNRLNLSAPKLVADLPAGGTRLVQHAQGYVATLKRGAVTFREGEATGELPGQVIR